MMNIRLNPLLGGLATWLVPAVAEAMARRNQPRVTAAYYYEVWLRHVCTAAHFQCWNAPATVLEIGPGARLGTGLTALLSGVQRYIAFDASAPRTAEFDPQLVQELVLLFRQRRNFAPSDRILPTTLFPGELFPDEQLTETLSNANLARITRSLQECNDLVCCLNDPASLPSHSVDYLFSHSVLEHVEDLAAMYRTMWRWLRPGGTMTHSIDLSSHGTSKLWNGHWTVPDSVWRMMRGKRRYFLNREPASTHRGLLEQVGFECKEFHLTRLPSSLRRTDLAPQFRQMSESDLTTVAAFIVARKPLL